ncbi:hypothetical protein SAMN02745136_04242 [Anaerocolumna jejuensis DSM 15929]|uniref:Uncharacterized protein n=2 Tax=Anaerocolumna TaxID=1843210 RepID=A0A1M6YFX1_9FIRM|nr:hypothetical protein SAMN02745136_04242 [Anaerocolumna jejuensis DSM 15929]
MQSQMTEGLQKGVMEVRIDSRNYYNNIIEKNQRTGTNNVFAEALNKRLSSDISNSGITDTFKKAKIKPMYLNYNNDRRNMSIKDIETENYKITQDENTGYITVRDKKAGTAVGMHSADDLVIQTDAATGTKLLINDLGGGFYCLVQVSDELEGALKKALNTDSLKQTELSGFQVHTDRKTGINYITANGYESRGGLLLLNDAGREKLISLADEFMEKYPNLASSIDEAIMYAAFEITGVAKRTENGIMMLGPNSLTFYNANGVVGWRLIFDEEDYDSIRQHWDSQKDSSKWENKEFWKTYLSEKSINYEEAEIGDARENFKEYAPDNSKTESEIIVKPDGSRVLLITVQVGGMNTAMSIEISKPTDFVNSINNAENEESSNDLTDTNFIQNTD